MIPNLDFRPLVITAFLGLTFGLWKIIDILSWLFSHVRIVIH